MDLGAEAIVLPQNWLFPNSNGKFREWLLKNCTWNTIARLGPGAFETISGDFAKATLTILGGRNESNETGWQIGDTEVGNLIRRP